MPPPPQKNINNNNNKQTNTTHQQKRTWLIPREVIVYKVVKNDSPNPTLIPEKMFPHFAYENFDAGAATIEGPINKIQSTSLK